MTGEKKQEGSEHYLKMDVQPFDVYRSMGILPEALTAKVIKYMMRAGARIPRDKYLEDLRKARHCLDLLIKGFE